MSESKECSHNCKECGSNCAERADQIIVLADGVVAESETYEKLMEKDGLYARLVKL